MRDTIRFLRRGKIVELTDVGPNETLLDYLRLREGSCGTKEGCGEGDCGACSVAVGTLENGAVRYQAVNSCIQLLGMLDGKEIVTVDDLAEAPGKLHPIQQAMVDHHGSQCGFCTPGIVMSLFALYHREEGAPLDRQAINDQLAGNLCRCTGYRPIVDAALESCAGKAQDRFAAEREKIVEQLTALQSDEDLFVGTEESFFAAPVTLNSLASLYSKHPDAQILAGATDVGLWITKQLRNLPKIIHVGQVKELATIEERDGQLVIGAGATYAQAEAFLAAVDPDVAELLRRIGSKQVRASGTIGGNIANGSPIGDTPPLLIALDAELELRQGKNTRHLPLEDFFLDYGKQHRKEAEFVSRIFVPRLEESQHLRCYKISKRFDQDISALLGAFRITLEGRTITAARVAFGGMAATPKRAPATEQALAGLNLDDPASWRAAAEALAKDYQPISDMRASADYRSQTARGLLLKALHELAGRDSKDTRVIGLRETGEHHAA